MSDEGKELPLDLEKGATEARVLKNEIAPMVERSVKGTAESNPELKKKAAPLGETGYLELGSQRLKQIETKYPDYYDALMARQDAITRLTDTLLPGYAPIWEGHGGMTPGQAKRRAGSLPTKAWEEARGSAEKTATTTIDYITRTVNDERRKAQSGYILELDIDTLGRVNKAIKEEIEDGHILHEHRIEARQIGALTEGVWATLNAIDQERLVKPEFNLDIGKALQKQEAFDKSKT